MPEHTPLIGSWNGLQASDRLLNLDDLRQMYRGMDRHKYLFCLTRENQSISGPPGLSLAWVGVVHAPPSPAVKDEGRFKRGEYIVDVKYATDTRISRFGTFTLEQLGLRGYQPLHNICVRDLGNIAVRRNENDQLITSGGRTFVVRDFPFGHESRIYFEPITSHLMRALTMSESRQITEDRK